MKTILVAMNIVDKGMDIEQGFRIRRGLGRNGLLEKDVVIVFFVRSLDV